MPTLIAGILGTTVSAGAFKWSHILQVPIVLLMNGYLAWLYYDRSKDKMDDTMRFGPLALHVLGTLLVLVQPIFDAPGGILYDMQHGYSGHAVKPPEFTNGGFWHHGYVMASFQVSGIVCIASASLWSSGVFEKTQTLLDEQNKDTVYGSDEKMA